MFRLTTACAVNQTVSSSLKKKCYEISGFDNDNLSVLLKTDLLMGLTDAARTSTIFNF